MVKEVWDSFKDNIKERITNPFLGTFVLVWVVHNWRVIYAFFFFDSGWGMQKRIDYFNEYWKENNFFWNLMCVALITIGILVITYLFLAISRYLAKIFENIVVPIISKFTKGKIVTSETHQSALDKIASLESRVEIERKAKNDAILERDEFEKKYYATITQGEDKDSIKDDNLSRIVSQNKDYWDLIKKVKLNPKLSKMSDTLLGISKKYTFGNDYNDCINFLLANDLIYFDKTDQFKSGFQGYNFTESGLVFKSQFFEGYVA